MVINRDRCIFMKVNIKKNAIFVSIASYRDDVCNSTLTSLFNMAKFPENVFVGICQQNNSDEDDDCLLSFENNSNVRIIRIPYYEARGPTYARYLCSTLWNGEEYFLQIDSHSKFVKDWDIKCIDMINKIKEMGLSQKPVLSHNPKEIESYVENDESEKFNVTRMCKSFFNNRGMISFMGSEVMDSKNIPYNTPYIAGGMLFCESYFLQELPFDPNLPYLFVGEEILHSIRFYTNGWDIFTPTENIVFHEYTRANKPKIWTDNPYYSDIPAFEKVKNYIGLVDKNNNEYDLPFYIKENMEKYGLGSNRTLSEYYDFAGIDVANKKVYKNFCRENNLASEEDINNSNENFTNEEKVNEVNQNHSVIFYLFILFLITLPIILIFLHIRKIRQ